MIKAGLYPYIPESYVKTWAIGIVLILLTIATAFLGYTEVASP